MIELLVSVIVFCVIAGLLVWLVTLLPLPEPFPMVIRVCVIIICILLLLGVVSGTFPVPRLRLG